MAMKTSRRFCCALVVASTMAIVGGVGTPRPAGAQAVEGCAGTHTWTLPNTTMLLTNATVTETWVRTCADVNSSGLPFGAVTVGPSNGGPGATGGYTGNCLVGFQPWGNGDRFFVGDVTFTESVNPTASEIGVMALPSAIPCLGGAGSTITWTGVAVSVGA